MTAGPKIGRWQNYVLKKGEEFHSFWQRFLQSQRRNVLFIIGVGFDPRMCTGINAILRHARDGSHDCVAIRFDEGSASPSRTHDNLIQNNRIRLELLLRGRGDFILKTVAMWSVDGRRRIGPRNVASLFEVNQLVGYSDIVVDISALPRTLYIPLLAKLLFLVDNWKAGSQAPNLHVVVAENPQLDHSIVSQGLDDDATYIHGFESGVALEATAHVPSVWMPILGEGKTAYFERIYDLLDPQEIAPILPFPSQNPRRSDDLILEYRNVLFERLRIEPRNLIYAPEQNPFGVYRQINLAVNHYAEALNPLGGCKIVLSILSSKLTSLGALLSAYELKQGDQSVGIAHVQAVGYVLGQVEEIEGEEDLVEVWLAGEAYATA